MSERKRNYRRNKALLPETEPEGVCGLECPNCGCLHFFVIWVRPLLGRVVRRKKCRHCGRRVTTTERLSG